MEPVASIISELIGNGLFPCAMCLILFWYIKDEQKNTREIIQQLDKSITHLTDIISFNYKEESVNHTQGGYDYGSTEHKG